jgi:hypothetical protein
MFNSPDWILTLNNIIITSYNPSTGGRAGSSHIHYYVPAVRWKFTLVLGQHFMGLRQPGKMELGVG